MGYIYLASPYSDPDPKVRHDRFLRVCAEAARIIRAGYVVFSPIAHSHPIALSGNLGLGFCHWEHQAKVMVARADEVWVLMLDGWERSKGVAAEVALAEAFGKAVKYVSEGEIYGRGKVAEGV